MTDQANLPQRLRDIAHGMNATSNQATLREAAADIERLWASEFTLIDDLRDEIDAGLRMGDLLHRMLEAPTTQISPSWKEEIRRSLANSKTPNKQLRRGVDGVCTRSTCECEREGLGDQCVWLKPAVAEFECLGEPSLCANPRGCACSEDRP